MVGFRMITMITRPDKDLVAAFAALDTGQVSDGVGKLYTMDAGMRPVYAHMPRIVGPAFTIRVPPGDNLMVHKAIHTAEPGDVLVVDAGGDTSYALVGGNVCAIAQQRGIVGLIADGVIRDVRESRERRFPIVARGIIPCPAGKSGPGEINTAILCGGVPVRPGDIIVADEEGVCVVPLDQAKEALAAARKKAEDDAAAGKDLGAWRAKHLKRLDEIIQAKGCVIE